MSIVSYFPRIGRVTVFAWSTSQLNESLENTHTVQHEEARAKSSSDTRQGPHGRQRGLYSLDATPVGKPFPDIAPDFEPCCNDKTKSMPGILLCATTTCVASCCPLVTNCSTFPPFFNTPDYWTEGLSKYSETLSVSKANNRNTKPHNRQQINSCICTVFKIHPSIQSPSFPHANMLLQTHRPASDSMCFFPDACTVKNLTHIYTYTCV